MVMMMENEELMMEEEELMMMEEEEMEAEDEKQSSVRVTHGVTWWRGPMIGKGSFGSVYLATLNPSLPLLSPLPPYIAVKSAEISVAKSLKKEREVLSDLKGCPYVIQCYGEETTMGENGEEVYNLLLEYASGGSLDDRIKKTGGGGGGLRESEVRRYTKSILSGISYVHEHGYVHHDVKPANILLVSDSRDSDKFTAKLGDFGLSKRVKQERHKKSSRYLRGTGMYISPDALVEGKQDASSDIWAIGCVVFEMLTGKDVWQREKDRNCRAFVRRIGYELETPEIPCEVSEEGKEFLKACFVWRGEDRLGAEALLSFPFVNQLHEEEEEEELEEEQEEEPMGSSCLDDASSVSQVEISWFGVGGEEDYDEEVEEVEESLNTKRESSNLSMLETDSDSNSEDESCTDEPKEFASVDSSVEAVDDFDYDEDVEGEEVRNAMFDPTEMWMTDSDDDNEDSSRYEYYPKEDEEIWENHKRRRLMTSSDVGNKETLPNVVAAF